MMARFSRHRQRALRIQIRFNVGQFIYTSFGRISAPITLLAKYCEKNMLMNNTSSWPAHLGARNFQRRREDHQEKTCRINTQAHEKAWGKKARIRTQDSRNKKHRQPYLAASHAKRHLETKQRAQMWRMSKLAASPPVHPQDKTTGPQSMPSTTLSRSLPACDH